MLDRFFGISQHGTTVRTEFMAGLTTFLTMAYIIFVQPQVLSGTGMDPGAVTAATCYSAALATAIMGLYARYPIAQAPGMGENFLFLSVAAVAAAASGSVEAGWQIALGVVFYSGVIFLVLSLVGLREALLDTISPSMRNAIAVGIGLFIALIGLRNAHLVFADAQGVLHLDYRFASPDLIVFFFGLLLTAGLLARRVRGSIFWGILGAAILSVAMVRGLAYAPESIRGAELVTSSRLVNDFRLAEGVVSVPPAIEPTLFKMDLRRALPAHGAVYLHFPLHGGV